ncbi:MAG: phosphate acyltransferase PlsX [Erysipelotrichaceae bacterium]
MKIAVDIMGGDLGPREVIKAALNFVKDYQDVTLVLYGNEEHLSDLKHESIECVATTQTMEMNDGALAIRRKKDASMVRAVESVSEQNDAVVSCGSTGALLTCATLILKTIEGIERPALLGVLPSKHQKGCVFLDLGASAENTSAHLLDFARMGDTYARKVMHLDAPRLGLLNIGSEAKKGDSLRKETYALLEASDYNFIGNIEANHLLDESADVVVCDGFSGNLVLKSLEGTARLFKSTLKEQMMKTIISKLGAVLSGGALKNMKNILDDKQYGGALLAGVNGVVIKAHGSSDAYAFYHALRQAYLMVDQNVIQTLKGES